MLKIPKQRSPQKSEMEGHTI